MGAIVFLNQLGTGIPEMMTLPILLELAQQGDATAIAVLMNAALKAEKIRVKVIVDRDCLLVMLRSLRPLNQHATIAFIRRGLLPLQPDPIRTVRAYAWHLGQDFPTWIAEFPIQPAVQTHDTLQTSLHPDQVEQVAEFPISPPAIGDRFGFPEVSHPSETPIPTSTTSSQPKSQRFRFSFLVVLVVLVYMAVTIG